jgi:hypothetical protein
MKKLGKQYRHPALLAFAVFAIVGLSCSPTRVAGGGSDTEVSGRIVTPNGKPTVGVSVSLLPQVYNPAFDSQSGGAMHSVTDANGSYRFRAVVSGNYNVQASDVHNGGLLLSGILVKSAPVALPSDSLRPTASLVVPLPAAVSNQSGYAYIQGTTLSKQISPGADAVVFDGVPQCTLPVVKFQRSALDTAVVLAANISVDSAGTVVVNPFDGWSHSAKVTINTSASGAAIAEPLMHFPLVLRLSAANFNFSQALPGGKDIRFSKQDGRPLAFEIAQWDTARKLAVIWISVDTVYGGSASQFVRMHWGNSAALPSSNPNAVFDTAYGFAAVWHLEEEKTGIGTPGLYKDATPNAADGDDYVSSTTQAGVVAYGHGFTGTDKIPTNSPVAEMARGNVTMCVWVNLAAPGGVVLSKGQQNVVQNPGVKQFYFGDGTPAGGAGLVPSFSGKGNGYAFSDKEVPIDSQWHFLVFRWQYESGISGTASFFLDGQETGITSTYTAAAPDNSGDVVTIAYNGIQYFSGTLDELHVSKTARSSDWLQLSYRNQSVGSGVVALTTEK